MSVAAVAAAAKARGADSTKSSAAPPRAFARPETASTPRRCACGGGCPSCRREKEELHRAAAETGMAVGFAPPVVHQVLASPGRPLAAETRGWMEERFGADLSAVRVHHEARAAESARAVGAHAYTVGRDVAFAAGRYAPGTPAGDRLLAHELAHTLQGGAATLRRQPADDPLLGGGPLLEPRSLGGSADFSKASPQQIQAEIEAIRRWLAGRPATATDWQTEHLRAELARLQGLNPPLQTTVWDGFASQFNQEFAGVLNVFAVPGVPSPAGAVRPAGASGDPLTGAQLQVLFTDTQRKKLQDFIASRRIPERLFNGMDRGKATAQQRLLLAAHILANGIYTPGSFDQRVHAQYCFHWVQIVHHYAGATPPGFDKGVMGTFDPLGAAALSTGKSIWFWHKKYVKKPDLPSEESPEGTGPLHAGTRHEEAARKAEEADPTKASGFHRQPSLPIAMFNQLQAGDWLWYYNANASGGGGHSVIFSHWEGETVTRPDGARYRVAVVWSQPSAKRGGVRHTARLGDRFVPNPANDMNPHVVPITHVSRVTPETAPATTAAQMLPGPEGKAATRLAEANAAFIKAKEKKLKGTVDRTKLLEWLRGKNTGFMVSGVDRHLPAEQIDVLVKVNQGDDLEALIRLYQRLRTLHTNARILDENMAAAYQKLDPEHAAAKAKRDGAVAAAVQEIGAVDVELASVKSGTAAGENRRAELDVQPRIDDLKAEAARLQKKISKMKAGPDRDEARDQRQHLLDRADALRTLQKEQAPDLAKAKDGLKTLAARKRELDAKRAKLEKARKTAAATPLPFGLVHPGKRSKEDTRGTTGRLKDLDSEIEWNAVMDPAPAAPATPKQP